MRSTRSITDRSTTNPPRSLRAGHGGGDLHDSDVSVVLPRCHRVPKVHAVGGGADLTGLGEREQRALEGGMPGSDPRQGLLRRLLRSHSPPHRLHDLWCRRLWGKVARVESICRQRERERERETGKVPDSKARIASSYRRRPWRRTRPPQCQRRRRSQRPRSQRAYQGPCEWLRWCWWLLPCSPSRPWPPWLSCRGLKKNATVRKSKRERERVED